MAEPKKRVTANELLLDALIRHQVYLMRLSSGLRLKIERLLNATEDDMEEAIRRRLRSESGDRLAKASFLQRVIRNIRLKNWGQITDTWVEETVEIAKVEPTFIAGIMRTVAPVILDLKMPPAGMLKALVTSKPFEGATLRSWAQSLARQDISRIEQQIKIGVVQGETSDTIARRITGTARLGGVDGVTEITRRAAEAITRTAVNHVANWAKRELYELNADILDEELFVATLDNRTTPVCRGNDGKIFPLGKGPIPPLHWRCRSLRVPIFNGEVLGDRPFKSSTERELVAEFAERRGLEGVKTRADIPRGLKGPFDKFAQARVRELTGRVPATTNYNSWLKTQTTTFQNDVLGATRGSLFRTGRIQLDQFINRRGDQLNLSELARLHRAVFVAAGLDPGDFL